MMENIVAIIGRPNVGKSTIFNRIMGKRIAIVHHRSGVTRDRNYGEAEWTGKRFFIIDTGGFVPDSEEEFNKQIRNQVRIALQEANKILFVTDGEAGVHPVDEEIATIIRKYHGKKEVLLAVNKVDNERRENNINEFYKLGLGTPFGISGLSGRNVADMLDILTKDIQQSDEKEDERIKFAIIGKPNAGKSSIINAILKEERNIVTDIPGTTRDSIDSEIKYHGESIVLIDTAGLRKKSKVSGESLDFFSAIRTYKSIQRCDVAILVIDASELMEGLSHSSDIRSAVFKLDKQDVRIIEEVVKFKKGILLVINKWDLVEKDSNTSVLIEKKINEHLKSYNYLKYIFISALTKQRIHKVIEEAKNIFDERKKTVKTSELNEKILNEIKKNPPASTRGKEIKINYVTQVKNAPPVFTFFSNEPAMIATNYRKFLEKRIRDNFGFQGVPIIMNFKKKN